MWVGTLDSWNFTRKKHSQHSQNISWKKKVWISLNCSHCPKYYIVKQQSRHEFSQTGTHIFHFNPVYRHTDITCFLFYSVPLHCFGNVGPKPLKLFYKSPKGFSLKTTAEIEITSFYMERFLLKKKKKTFMLLKGRGHRDLLTLAILHRLWELT